MKEKLRQLALSAGLALAIGGLAAGDPVAEARNTDIAPAEAASSDASEEDGNNWEPNSATVAVTIGGLAAAALAGLIYVSKKSQPKNHGPNG